MNAVRGGTVTWRPQPWQDGDGGGGEPLSDSDSEEEDFPDDSTTPLGDYITQGEADKWWIFSCSSWHLSLCDRSFYPDGSALLHCVYVCVYF